MNAIVYNFESKIFEFKSIRIPIPEKGYCRIKVQACGVNPIDSKSDIWGELIPAEKQENFVVGVDVAGIIDEIGIDETDEACDFKIGDRIVCHPWLPEGFGGYAEYSIVRTKFMFKIPDGVSFEEAAATPVAGWTAYKAITKKMRVTPDSNILITGGNGGLGGFGIQIAKSVVGCKRIITTCSPTSNDRVLSLGATHCIDYSQPIDAIVSTLLEITGGVGVDFILDGTGGESAKGLAGALSFDGQIACCAGVMPRSISEPYFKGVTVHDIALAPPAYLGGDSGLKMWREIANEFMDFLQTGKLHAMVTRRLALSDLPMEFATGRLSGGKTVVIIP